jgi:putative transposase
MLWLPRGIAIRLACWLFSISEACYPYRAKFSEQNTLITGRLLRLTYANGGWGLPCFLYLRNVKG